MSYATHQAEKWPRIAIAIEQHTFLAIVFAHEDKTIQLLAGTTKANANFGVVANQRRSVSKTQRAKGLAFKHEQIE